ncbi:MAG: flagellar export chaperone FliS [bacterium]
MEQKPFPTYSGNQYAKYKTNSVETASPLMLVLMLYDEAIKMCKTAVNDFGKNKETVHNKLIKAQKVLTELTVALNPDVGGELVENLKALYIYMHMRLVEANVENDKKKIEEVLNLLVELREAWQHVSTEQRKNIVRQAGHISTES